MTNGIGRTMYSMVYSMLSFVRENSPRLRDLIVIGWTSADAESEMFRALINSPLPTGSVARLVFVQVRTVPLFVPLNHFEV